MNFNLTIQEAIQKSRENPKLFFCCECGNDGALYTLYNFAHSNLPRTYGGLSSDGKKLWLYVSLNVNDILSKWAIYEEPKEEKMALWKTGSQDINHQAHIKIVILPQPQPFVEDGIHAKYFKFYELKEAKEWNKGLQTFMLLKSHPLAVPADEREEQHYIRYNDCNDDIIISQARNLEYKLTMLSPMFAGEEDANKALSDIGKENIIHMFKTFQGVYK